jgi:hypothetical protein
MPSFAYQVDNGPVIFPSLQVLDRKMCQLRSAKAAPEADRENASAAFATDRLDVGGVKQRFGLIGTEPIAQPHPEFFAPFTRRIPAANSGLSRPVSAAS